MADRLVTLAAVAGAHGISGEVRLKLFSNGIESLKRHRPFDAVGRALTLQTIRPDKGGAVARFAQIAYRTDSEKLRGTVIAVSPVEQHPLAVGEYSHASLPALPF